MVFYHVIKNLVRLNTLHKLARFVHSSKTESHAKVLVPLKNRKLLKIYGEDSSEFLQGLITNDMRHFDDGAKSVYAMFLNNKGRVLYDTLLHQWEDKDSFVVECDRSNFGLLLKHLNMFKLKRKVRIEDMNKEYCLWALLTAGTSVPDAELDPKSQINIYKDPRLQELGCRILTVSSLKGPQIVEMIGRDVTLEGEDVYNYVRYKLGVCEGSADLPPGVCFPLETNCDYLHGVSFHKGCYIGQELTARIYHTGVIRKRVMPIRFLNEVKDYIERDFPITSRNNPDKKLGKIKNFFCDYGIALLNVKDSLDAQTLQIGENTAEVIKPAWWPKEAPKEKIKLDGGSKVE